MADTRTITTVKQPYFTSDGTKLYLGTSTEVKVDKNGKYIPDSAVVSLRLYDTTNSLLGTDYKTVAIRNSGESWRFTQDGNGTYVAGASLQQTLANKNSLMNINLNNHVSKALSAPLQGVPAGQVNTNTQSSSNAALSLPVVAPEEEDAVKPALDSSNVNVSIADGNKVRKNYKNTEGQDLCYPIDMRSTSQDRIRFAMIRYASKNVAGTTFGFGGPSRNFTENLGAVTLPIPQGITDDNGVDWGGQTLSPVNAYLAGAATRLIQSDDYGQRLTGELGKASLEFKKFLNENKTAADLYLAQEAVGIQGLLSRATGAIVNPNLELLFGGPALRQFNFVFKLSARDQPEAAEIRKIIRFFKQGSSVKSGGTQGIFLKAPNVFNIQYKTFKGEKMINHPSLNRIKTCALLGCSVDYTPDGSYMTYNDPAHTMTSYQLTLRFTELTPVIEDDYFDTKSDFEGGKLSTDKTGTTDIGF